MSTTPELDTPPQGVACPLLELPAELRNEIYGLVLCKNDRIVVSSAGYEREGLLSVCKQVRQEALKIYYYENKFVVEVHKWNSDNLLAFEKVLRRLGLKRAEPAIRDGKHVKRVKNSTSFTSAVLGKSAHMDAPSAF